MSYLMIDIKDLIYYVIIIVCLLIIAVILLKYWSLRKEEKEQVVVRKIEDPKPKPIVKPEVKEDSKVQIEEEEEFTSELADVLEQMQKNLESGKNATQIFEVEQEEKAIISYQELVRANLKQEINPHNEFKDIPADDIKAKAEDIEDEFSEIPIAEEIPILDNQIKKEEKKFKHTDFISPIYGTMDVSSIPKKTKIDEARDIDIEKTLNLTGLSEEKKKNAEFLQSLKEFRNNL